MRTPSEIASELGYPIHYRGAGYVASRPLYRGGDSKGLLIYPDHFWDSAANRRGTIVELAQLTQGWTKKQAEEWFNGGEVDGAQQVFIQKEKESKPDKFNPKELELLIPNYHFYLQRGIRKETLETFKGGLCMKGRMYGRFTFPIYHKSGEIRGMAGRVALKNHTGEKWKIIGEKKFFDYPFFLTEPFIKEKKEVILVESIGDMMALWNAGVKNTLVTFGVSLFKELFLLVLSLGVKVIVSLNNDETCRGQVGGEKIRKKLSEMMSPGRVIIALPTKGDFGEMTETEIRAWAKEKLNYD